MQLPAWLDAMERRFGGWAIPRITRVIVGLNALTFFLELLSPGFTQKLLLDSDALYKGEVWRVITFLFVPRVEPGENMSFIFLLLTLWFTWFVGDILEEEWGAFKLNFYLLLSVLAFTGAALFMHSRAVLTSLYIIQSLFFAVATLFPSIPITLFPIPIPIKIKWVAIFLACLTVLDVLSRPSSFYIIASSLTGYAVYILPGVFSSWRLRQASKRRMREFRNDDEDID